MSIQEIQKATLNQLANTKNQWQGDRKRLLCCCSAGLLRSQTTSHILNQKYGYNTCSCGLEVEYAKIPCTQALVYWADEIVVMNQRQKKQVEEILESLPNYCNEKEKPTPIKVLKIQDSYEYMETELVRLILENYDVN